MYVKYRPDETCESRRVVGSVEASEIDALWRAQQNNEREIRFASYARERELVIERLSKQRLVPGVVACFVRFAGPLRHGDCFEVIWCNERAREFRTVDLNAWALHRTIDRTQPAPIQVLPLTLVSGASVEFVDPNSGFVRRCVLRLSADRAASWALERPEDGQARATGDDYWRACG